MTTNVDKATGGLVCGCPFVLCHYGYALYGLTHVAPQPIQTSTMVVNIPNALDIEELAKRVFETTQRKGRMG